MKRASPTPSVLGVDPTLFSPPKRVGVADSAAERHLTQMMARMAAMETQMFHLNAEREALLRERDLRGNGAASVHAAMQAAAQAALDEERRKDNAKVQEVVRQTERRLAEEHAAAERVIHEERAAASRVVEEERARMTRQVQEERANMERHVAAVTSPRNGPSSTVPKAKDMKFEIKKFDGKEVDPGLGFGFED